MRERGIFPTHSFTKRLNTNFPLKIFARLRPFHCPFFPISFACDFRTKPPFLQTEKPNLHRTRYRKQVSSQYCTFIYLFISCTEEFCLRFCPLLSGQGKLTHSINSIISLPLSIYAYI